MNDRADALPCLACRKPLQQAMGDLAPSDTNQPSHGLGCSTPGNYGSAVFDSIMGTSRLLFSICDDCMRKAGEDGIVRWWRQSREVVVEEEYPGFKVPVYRHVGWEPLDRPLIPWQPGTAWESDDERDDRLVVEPEEVGKPLGKVEWR